MRYPDHMKKKVVIVGGGFGGLAAARTLAKIDSLEILLIDRRNFHLFQPLLYQIAMAGLNPADISAPLRTVFCGIKNVKIIMAEVDKIDYQNKQIHFDNRSENYDYLILSCGVAHSYFGKNHWEEFAPGLKSLEQAIEIRKRILTAFELAEKTQDPIELQRCLNFVVVGGGPTGVELAGAIKEMASHTLKGDFRSADLTKTRVILVEAGPRILPSFPDVLSKKATQSLLKLGVEVRTDTRADELSHEGLKIGNEFIPTRTILWAAGVKASKLASQLPGEKDPQGKVFVNTQLSLVDFPEVFVIGDMAAFPSPKGETLPGIAPVAIQQEQFIHKIIRADLAGQKRPDFKYIDKGIMATIGRSKAVAHTFGLNFSGTLAWLAWVFIHIIYLVSFKNQFFVFLQWTWSYFTFGRGARLITYRSWRFYGSEKSKVD